MPRKLTDSPQARKLRSMKRLRALKVPAIANLPPIERGRPRSVAAIVDRIIGLQAVVMKAFKAPAEMQASFAKAFKPATKLSPAERAFMRAKKPDVDTLKELTWRCEALEVLLWSIGLTAELPPMNADVSPQAQLDLVEACRDAAGLKRVAQRRSHAELLDASDLLYRAHWAVRDSSLRGKKPARALAPDVVLERDHASRWLLSQGGQAWDDDSCDT